MSSQPESNAEGAEGEEQKAKTPAQLKKEAEKKAKLEKFQQKQQKMKEQVAEPKSEVL